MTQREIDISNLRFYAKMAREFKWGTDVIHFGVIEQTLASIADDLAAAASPQAPAPPHTVLGKINVDAFLQALGFDVNNGDGLGLEWEPRFIATKAFELCEIVPGASPGLEQIARVQVIEVKPPDAPDCWKVFIGNDFIDQFEYQHEAETLASNLRMALCMEGHKVCPHRADKANHGTCRCSNCAVTKRELDMMRGDRDAAIQDRDKLRGELDALRRERQHALDECVLRGEDLKAAETRVSQLSMVLDLVATHELFVQSAEGEGWVFWVNVNDMFYPASDGEGIDISEIPAVWQAWKDKDWPGVVRWVQEKRGGMKLRKSREERILTIESLQCRAAQLEAALQEILANPSIDWIMEGMSRKLARECIINWAASVIAYREFYGFGGEVTFRFACDGREARVKARKILKELCAKAPPMKGEKP